MPTPSAAPSNVDLTHFLSLPWCAALLSAPHTTLLPTPSRTPKSSTEDSLFAITLHTGDTLRYMVSFSSPRSGTTGTGAGAGAELPPTAPGSKEGGLENEVVSTLFSMGDGMNGYPAVAHGGLIAALFDEAMGVAMMRLRASAADLKNPAGMADIVTASLKVDFVRMLGTPGEVVVRVWVGEKRGRKWMLRAEMVGVEGVVARGEAVWVEIKGSL